MPAEARPSDSFSRDNLLIGFSIVEFTPAATGASAVPLGILAGQSLEKTVETLQLQRGDSGTLTVDREIISAFEASLSLELYNFRRDIAQYIFGASTLTAQTATAVSVTNEAFNIPATDPFDSFVSLARGDIDESTVEVTCATITDELVGTGDGATNSFILDYKVKAVGDVTSVTVGSTTYSAVAVAGATSGNEVEVIVGETDGAAGTGSGSLEFYVGGSAVPPPDGDAIVVTYTPSFSTTAGDIANLTDFAFDPILGRIRMLDPTGSDNSPFRATGDSQPLEIDYDWSRKAGYNMQPFTALTAEGAATVKHLTDIGVNFIWTIPSVTVRLTDDALTFGADDFATATLQMNINDAGGSDRFGTMQFFSETEAAA